MAKREKREERMPPPVYKEELIRIGIVSGIIFLILIILSFIF